MCNKVEGRVGDSPLFGAGTHLGDSQVHLPRFVDQITGTFASNAIAISCTGDGELFIRASVAARGT